MILQSMYKNGLILTAFALATTGSVALVQAVTADRIAEQEQQHLMQLLNQVLPKHTYDNVLYKNCVLSDATQLGPNGPHKIYRAYKGEQPSALLIQHVTPQGYSGNIDVLTAIKVDGSISGVRVTRHEETPGLGDKVELAKSDWITHFNNERVTSENDPRFAVKKEAGHFDQFTGATITPRAVIESVNRAAWYAQNNFGLLFKAENACGDPE